MKHLYDKIKVGLKHLILLICLLLYLNACTFDQFKEYISPLTPPNPIEVFFETDDPAFNNPYYLLGYTRFHFHMKDITNEIAAHEVKLDGFSIISHIENNGITFFLDPREMSIGNHTIYMSLFLDSNSGSLANKLGAEFYEISQALTVVIDPTPPEFNSFSGSLKNGYMTLDWNKSNKKNFFYKITRYNNYSEYIPDTIIYDTDAVQFVDPGYVGGIMYYQVTAVGFGFEVTVGEGSFDNICCDFSVIRDKDGIVRLIWTESYIDDKNVQVQIKTFKNGEKIIINPFSPSGNIIIDNIKFTEQLTVFVELFRKGFASHSIKMFWQIPAIPNIKPFLKFGMLKNSNRLLIANENNLYRYKLEGIILEDSLSFQEHGINFFESFTVSADESIVFIGDLYGNLISLNPLDFSEVRYYNTKSIINNLLNSSDQIHSMKLGNVSNNGILTLNLWCDYYYALVVDIKNNKVLWQSPPSSTFPPIISSNGNYFAIDKGMPFTHYEGWIFKRNGEAFEALGKTAAGKHAFLAKGNEVIAFTEIDSYSDIHQEIKVVAYDLNNPPQASGELFHSERYKSILNYFDEMYLISSLDYDPCSDYLVIKYGEKLRLMNLSSMNFDQTINGGESAFFSNHYILRSNGFLEPIK
jgi:hypothetical protein